jgi:hypothetical protein
MFFLMNDVVLSLAPHSYAPPVLATRFAALTPSCITTLGQELFAEEPQLQHTDHERALRLAALVVAKSPRVNAALFAAPMRGCRPDAVGVRYAELDLGVLARLFDRSRAGVLTAAIADREVWERWAA